MLFLLVQTVYWLALSTWFGGVLFVAMAAPIIFRTVRESDPLLPTVLSVNLEGQHGTLLAGSIVGNILAALLKVQLACAAAVGLMIAAQWFVISPQQFWTLHLLRTALFLAAAGLLVYDWRGVWPQIERYRQEYLDHADEPDVANPAKEQFDRYHRESVTVMAILLAALLGIVLFSVGLAPTTTIITRPG